MTSTPIIAHLEHASTVEAVDRNSGPSSFGALSTMSSDDLVQMLNQRATKRKRMLRVKVYSIAAFCILLAVFVIL